MTFIQKVQFQNINKSAVLLRKKSSMHSVPDNYDNSLTGTVRRIGQLAQNIEARIRSNPVVVQLLEKYEIPLKVNLNTLENLQRHHLKDARIVAAKVCFSLPGEIKSDLNVRDLQQAALLHDYGKILIPEEILNKKGRFTDDERRIMELHPVLGYELLKNEGLNDNVLKLIKYHHQDSAGCGYPKAEADYNHSLAFDILHIADEYSALREERPYKKAMSKRAAFETIARDREDGKISPVVFEALLRAV